MAYPYDDDDHDLYARNREMDLELDDESDSTIDFGDLDDLDDESAEDDD
jgi:hypothetical protein